MLPRLSTMPHTETTDKGGTYEPQEQWKYVEGTNRYYKRVETRERRLFLIVGADAEEPPGYWFSVYHKGEEIAQGEGLDSIEEAKKAAEAA